MHPITRITKMIQLKNLQIHDFGIKMIDIAVVFLVLVSSYEDLVAFSIHITDSNNFLK